jgi:hypothetical protein
VTRRNQPHDIFRLINMSGGPDTCWPFKGKLNSKGRPYFTVDGEKFLAYRCNPKHIVPGDHQANMNDMKERERHGMPHHVVRAIRKLATKGMTHQEIADLYGKGRSTITEVLTDVNYTHVKDEDDV